MFNVQHDAYPEMFCTLAHADTLTKTLIGHHESTAVNSQLSVWCELVPITDSHQLLSSVSHKENGREKITWLYTQGWPLLSRDLQAYGAR